MISDDEILKTAKERYNDCEEVWGEYKVRCTDILRFLSGDQWTESARNNYENNGFTAITEDRLKSFVRQITAELQKNPPTGQIEPKEDTDTKQAKLFDEIVRGIQLDTNADLAYVEAAESACNVGIGYWRVRTELPLGEFEQRIIIEPIYDTNSVMLDPTHRSLAGQDAEFGFIASVMSKDTYVRKFGQSKLAAAMLARSAPWSPAQTSWVSEDEITICEYYFKDYEERTLVKVQDNRNIEVKTMYIPKDEAKLLEFTSAVEEGDFTILAQRTEQVPIVRWAKLNDMEVLEQTVCPGTYIPIVPVKGDEFWLEGRRKIIGAVEPAMDAQVMLNYYLSYQAQLMQMAPKAPYIGTANQFKTYEQQWQNINVSNQAFIPYNKDEGAAPPARDLGEVPIQNLSSLIAQAGENMKSIFGIFDPALGAPGNEISGKAILARQQQSFNSSYHFYDHLCTSIEHTLCILLEYIPVVHDTPQLLTAVDKTGKKRSLMVNADQEQSVDLSKGKYRVAIQTGPSFGTKRQEAAEALMELVAGLPDALKPAIADLAVKNMDWPDAELAAKSLAALVPPAVQQARAEGDEDLTPMQASMLKQQLQQAGQQAQQLQQELQVAHEFGQGLQVQLNQAKEETKLAKQNNEVDMYKAREETAYKNKDLVLKEKTTELEYLVKDRELDQVDAQLAIERAKLGLTGIQITSEIMDGVHDREQEHISMNAPDSLQPSDIKDIGESGFSGETLD